MTSPYAPVGTPLPAPQPSADFEQRLMDRRSTPAQTLSAPGPDADQLTRMLAIAARTPDHGKLFPWRFVILDAGVKARIADKLLPLAARQPGPDKAAKVLMKLTASPVAVMVVSKITPDHKIPEWEQVLSSGAVCMNLLHAADALGFGGNWISDWYSYDADALALFGVAADERVAGFIHIGTPAEPSLERARPDLSAIVSRLD